MGGNTERQWPDNITSGDIRYDPSGFYEGGFILRDADHGIPVFGSVNVQVFNYPGQTEDIAKALCDRWNSYASSQAEIERLRTALEPFAVELNDSYRGESDHSPFGAYFSLGAIRAAFAALSGSKEP